MFKVIPLGACLVLVAALMGAGAVSARAGTSSVPLLSSQSTEFATLTASINLGGENHSIENKGGGNGVEGSHRSGLAKRDGSSDDENEPEDEGNHPPTPEPGTLLSFAAALGIGGGVFLLGRLRKERR